MPIMPAASFSSISLSGSIDSLLLPGVVLCDTDVIYGYCQDDTGRQPQQKIEDQLMDTLNAIINQPLFGLLTFLVGLLLGHLLTKSRFYEEHRFTQTDRAVETFRNTILKTLHGLYPQVAVWNPQQCDRFRDTLPDIECAVAMLRPYVSQKDRLDQAAREYRDCCASLTFDSQGAWAMYPSMRESEESPLDRFTRAVNALLSISR
jgi:hypothetical protein